LNELLVAQAGQKSMPVVPPKDAEYTIRGYLVAAPDPKGTKLSYIWDVSDRANKRKRFQGEELIEGKKGGDPWAAVDDTAMQKVAIRAIEEISAYVPKGEPGAPAVGGPGGPGAPAGPGGPGAAPSLSTAPTSAPIAPAASGTSSSSGGFSLTSLFGGSSSSSEPAAAPSAEPASLAPSPSASGAPAPVQVASLGNDAPAPLRPASAPQPQVQPRAAAAPSPRPSPASGPVLAAAQTTEPAAAPAPRPAAPQAASAEVVAVVPSVSGAPGDGGQSLTAAMRKHLQSAGVKLVERGAGPNVYTVKGSVEMGGAENGQQPITIQWTVVDPSGKALDKAVVQKNKVAEGSLDGPWGQIADMAAGEAAKSVAKLITKPTG
jgi:hypothetical protein